MSSWRCALSHNIHFHEGNTTQIPICLVRLAEETVVGSGTGLQLVIMLDQLLSEPFMCPFRASKRGLSDGSHRSCHAA